jgi:CYTH domain-containing protein
MAYKEEIERKFLIDRNKLPELPQPYHLTQGYLSFSPTVRVRLEEGPQERKGYLTIKGSGLVGRDEFEYEIPADEVQQLLKLAKASLVSKRRYHLPVPDAPDLKWEVDIFEGDNEGLNVAELEMPTHDYKFQHPEWLGKDVTEDPRYKNAALAQNPFKNW